MSYTPLKNSGNDEVDRLLDRIDKAPEQRPPPLPDHGFWYWYCAPWRKYAVVQGRARRREYWTFQLVNLAILVPLMIGGAGADPEANMVCGILLILLAAAVFAPTLAVSIRRLHDSGKHGALVLLNFIPIVGPLVLLVFFLLPSSPGENPYGLDPSGHQQDGSPCGFPASGGHGKGGGGGVVGA